MTTKKADEKRSVVKSATTKPSIPLRKVPEIKKVIKPANMKLRYFIAEFSIGYKKEGIPGVMNQSASIPGAEVYPSRKELASQLPGVYGITEANGFTDIVTYNIRLWELPKDDFEAFMKE